LVEDNVINQKVALRLLKTLGYSADAVADGQQAVDALSKVKYDLVFMDCMMPVMDGYEATTAIRDPNSTVLNHNIPVIAMTANAMKEDRDRCIDAGMDDYIPKPVKKEVLAAQSGSSRPSQESCSSRQSRHSGWDERSRRTAAS
jgi:CheY-like chemotaxis protein